MESSNPQTKEHQDEEGETTFAFCGSRSDAVLLLNAQRGRKKEAPKNN
jgi:hypothetical protein